MVLADIVGRKNNEAVDEEEEGVWLLRLMKKTRLFLHSPLMICSFQHRRSSALSQRSRLEQTILSLPCIAINDGRNNRAESMMIWYREDLGARPVA